VTPRQVGNYRLDSLLGSGGMGEVYKAYDTHRDRYVALKLLPQAFSGDREYLKRFQRESHVAARLTEPHVIPIHDFGEIDGQLFIDMRLVEGTDIGTLIDTSGRIEPQQAVYLISQVAQALDAAHADNLVHRDIKPSNILVTSGDFVYVVDFGIARTMGGRQTALTITGATIGTLHYMAPERFVGHDVDGRADVYSLACVLHECLTGTPPFTGKDLPALMYAQLYYGPPPASSLVDGVPPALDAVIARGMAKDPQDRFPTAGMLAAAAREALLAEEPATAPPPPPMTQLQAPTWTETPAPAWTETPAPAWNDVPAPTWNDISVPPWRAPTSVDARQGAAKPPGPEAGPAGDRSARGVPDSPTQTVLAVGGDDWGSTRPPESMPQGLDPNGSRLPPGAAAGGPERRPAWRRLSVLILVVAAALAVPIALVLMASNKPNRGGAPVTPNAGGATRSSVPSAVPSLAVPTVAGKIQVGQTPSYIQVAPNGKFAYVANPGAGVITVLNTADDLVSGSIKITQGPPQFVSFSPDSKTAYISVYDTRSTVHLIAFVDTATDTVTSTVSVDNHTPGPSTTSPDGRFLYVPNHNTAMSGAGENVVDVIDTASKNLVGRVAVPANPHWVAFDKNGHFYTTDHMSATVTVLNAHNNGILSEIDVGETPHSEAVSPDGSRLAVTSFDGNVVYLINTATDKEIARIPVGKNPLDIAYSPDGRYLCTVNNQDNTVTVINTADYRVIGEVAAGKAPTSISMLPNGLQAYVTDEGDGTVEVLNIAK
jgi:YVTN family beta-propeller protein